MDSKKARVNGKQVAIGLLLMPRLNYGQMQRWIEFDPLEYELEIAKGEFLSLISECFDEFRENEIEEDDPEGVEELIAYQALGYPELEALYAEKFQVLEGGLKQMDYLTLDSLFVHPAVESHYYYSVNSLDSIDLEGDKIILKGICFKSDYV